MIESWVINYVQDRNMYVLRQKKDGKPLNVAYTQEGLKWSTTISGRSLYFKNWRYNPSQVREVFDTWPMSDEVYIEKFVPRQHRQRFLNEAEYSMASKALRMLYYSANNARH